MERNIGTLDARLRLLLAAVLLGISVVFNAQPLVALATALVAVVLAGTGLTRSCPLYSLLRFTSIAAHKR